jgi:hypothetical protein
LYNFLSRLGMAFQASKCSDKLLVISVSCKN